MLIRKTDHLPMLFLSLSRLPKLLLSMRTTRGDLGRLANCQVAKRRRKESKGAHDMGVSIQRACIDLASICVPATEYCAFRCLEGVYFAAMDMYFAK